MDGLSLSSLDFTCTLTSCVLLQLCIFRRRARQKFDDVTTALVVAEIATFMKRIGMMTYGDFMESRGYS